MGTRWIIPLIVFVLPNAALHNKIVIQTNRQAKLYHFFPLECSNMWFLVKATNDIHISFTQEPNFQPPYYEIVFGGWSNSKSVIRKDKEDPRDERTGPAVTPDEFSYYWANLNVSEKSVSAGTGTKKLMSFIDPHFVPMNYFGISTGFGSDGEWHFSTNDFCCKAVCISPK